MRSDECLLKLIWGHACAPTVTVPTVSVAVASITWPTRLAAGSQQCIPAGRPDVEGGLERILDDARDRHARSRSRR